jgi:hypothetical protein
MRATAGIVLVPVAVLLALVYWGMAKPSPLPPRYENPGNRYYEILAIAEKVQNLNQAPIAGHPNPAAEFAALIRKLKPLLDGENSVDVSFDLSEIGDGWNRVLKRERSWRSLARALDAESQAAIDNKQPNLAAEYAEANLRLGAMLGRGGFVVDTLVGQSFQGAGMAKLAEVRAQITSQRARDQIALLQQLHANRESLSPVFIRDSALTDRLWPERFGVMIDNWLAPEDNWRRTLEGHLQRKDALSHLLQAELAIRLFCEDHQRLPASLQELVPDYLPAVPLDPYSGQKLLYRVSESSHMLYSVGPDGVDNGGKLGNWKEVVLAGFDLDIDANNRRAPTSSTAAADETAADTSDEEELGGGQRPDRSPEE